MLMVKILAESSIVFKVKAECGIQPQAWHRHVEDWIPYSNAEIGHEGRLCKDF